MTKDECLHFGGHCWQEPRYLATQAIVGGKTEGIQDCKHCTAQRKMISQSPWRYEEI